MKTVDHVKWNYTICVCVLCERAHFRPDLLLIPFLWVSLTSWTEYYSGNAWVLSNQNKARYVRITKQCCTFACPLLPWKRYKYYAFWVCVCVCVCVCVLLLYPACKSRLLSAALQLALAACQTPPHRAWFSGKRVTEYKMCFDFLHFCLKHFSIKEEFSEISS